jgi:hypothetical protein
MSVVMRVKDRNLCASLRSVLRCRHNTCIWGEVHASVVSLLDVTFDAELVDEEVLDIAARDEDEAKRRSVESKRMVSAFLLHLSYIA